VQTFLRRGLEGDLASLRGLVQHQLPQAALRGTPLQAMKDWFKSNPELFHRTPYDRLGGDSYQPRTLIRHGVLRFVEWYLNWRDEA